VFFLREKNRCLGPIIPFSNTSRGIRALEEKGENKKQI
jgi:hypothetical protein